MTSSLVYWITRLDAIQNVCECVAIGMVFITLGYIIVRIYEAVEGETENFRKLCKLFRVGVVLLVIFSILATFIPSTKEAAAIYMLPKIANNEDVQEIPANVAKILNQKLREWLDDFEGETEKAGE